MGKLFKLLGLFVLAGLAYRLFWPVPVDPQAWDAPENAGYVGDYTPNKALESAELINIGDNHGPEDAAIGADGAIYAAVLAGKIIRIDPTSGKVTDFAVTGGRPLGVEFAPSGALIVADTHKGVLSISTTGKITVLTDSDGEGNKLLYADDLDIAPNGKIYFSDASSKFGAQAYKGTLESSLLDLMEHGGHGRILVYDPATKKTSTLIDGLNFANGVAMASDGSYFVFAETGSYSISKHWLNGDKQGITETIIENLPGFPDNINQAGDGTFWVGLASPRCGALDALSGYPFLRKMTQRLPAALRPKAQFYGFVARFDGEGKVLETLQGPSGKFPLTTGAVAGADGALYITSLAASKLGKLKR